MTAGLGHGVGHPFDVADEGRGPMPVLTIGPAAPALHLGDGVPDARAGTR